MLASCRSGAASNVSAAEPTAGDTAAETAAGTLRQPVDELPLPDVPSTLREPATRAAYIIEHFWDKMEFTDTVRSHNTDFVEQAFANFISIFPYAGAESQRTAVGTLMRRAEADSTAYVVLTEVAEKYLYEPNSPMLSEDYYILFLEQMVASPVLGPYGTIRPRWQLEAARKNRPGMKAADFAFTTREGRRTTLHRTPSDGNMLLIFYDPDCDHCKEIIATLCSDEVLNRMTSGGELTVVAVYSGDERELWSEHAPSLPAGWTVGYEPGDMQERGTYVLRAMPTLYLLDRDKKVILKDVLAEQLLYMLHGGQ